ncbi:MAG: type II toxin-antitoxin system VapC family toxin [Nitrospirae bacterium]|nr:type II toxin-antitoxin system VapC family toxin [Nitrospirota bacterium]
MNFLLDTSTVAFWYDKDLNPKYQKLHKRISELTNQDNLCISVLTLYELQYSISNADEPTKSLLQLMFEKTKNSFKILFLTEKGAQVYGDLKRRLKDVKNISRENIKKYNIDIMLASSAIIESCTLVSSDSDFEVLAEIDDRLKFQNWLD